MNKKYIPVIAALLLTPSIAFAALWCKEYVEVPNRPCPVDGDYLNHDEYYKCGLEREAGKIARWKEIAKQINELAKELPNCALVFTPDAPCKDSDPVIK